MSQSQLERPQCLDHQIDSKGLVLAENPRIFDSMWARKTLSMIHRGTGRCGCGGLRGGQSQNQGKHIQFSVLRASIQIQSTAPSHNSRTAIAPLSGPVGCVV